MLSFVSSLPPPLPAPASTRRAATRGPLVMLCFYAVLVGIASGLSPDGELSGRAEAISSLLHPLIIAWWVVSDALNRRKTLCYDYGTFVFFAWIVVVPVYLFQTRGARALLTIASFIGIWLTSLLLGSLIAAFRADL